MWGNETRIFDKLSCCLAGASKTKDPWRITCHELVDDYLLTSFKVTDKYQNQKERKINIKAGYVGPLKALKLNI